MFDSLNRGKFFEVKKGNQANISIDALDFSLKENTAIMTFEDKEEEEEEQAGEDHHGPSHHPPAPPDEVSINGSDFT